MSTDLKLEAVVIPVADVDRAKAFYEQLGVEARRRLRLRQRLPGRPVHAAGLAGARSSSARNITHGRAGLGPGPLPGRLRHRGRARRARRPRCRGQRGVPPRDAGRAVPGRRHERSSRGPARRARQLRLLRHVQRPGRQQLAAAGGHHAAARPRSTPLRRRTPRWTTWRAALRRAATAHGEHEKRNGGESDEKWPEWYAAYMVAEQAGQELPQ